MFLEAVVRKCSIKKVFLKISQILQENTRAGNFIKKETLAQVFSCEIAKFLRKPFFKEHLRWLLLFFHVINNYLELNWSLFCFISFQIFRSDFSTFVEDFLLDKSCFVI